jgi:exopolysaccharide biosynthesis polyprenyl glycosylphosphotransferase
MQTRIPAGAGAGAISTGGFPARCAPIRTSTAWTATWARFVRTIGRAALAMPASSWMLADIVLLAGAVVTGLWCFPAPPKLDTPHVAVWQAVAVFTFSLFIASLVFGLYESRTIRSRSRILLRIALTGATTTIIAYAIIYVIMYSTVGRRATTLGMVVFVVSAFGVRALAWWLVQRVKSGLLVVGSRSLYESFQASRDEGLLDAYQLLGWAETPGGIPNTNRDGRASADCFGRIDHRTDELQDRGVTDIVVSDAAARDPRVMEWMVPCLRAGCRVTNEATFYETVTGQILVDEISPSWFLFADLKVHCDEHASLKRSTDLIVSALGLVISAPLWLLIAAAVKLCDRGPVFYWQDRVGQHGEIFRLYKFRTMRPDAENGKSVWSTPNDPRVTAVGRLLRRARLDELPQLFNVLRGDMSLVGPRPERPDIVAELAQKIPFYHERHLVKPGITGWAQISFRYGNTIADAKRKLQFDLYYLKNMSFELDIIILFRTLGTFLRGAC